MSNDLSDSGSLSMPRRLSVIVTAVVNTSLEFMDSVSSS
jgi:hypothetical protein